MAVKESCRHRTNNEDAECKQEPSHGQVVQEIRKTEITQSVAKRPDMPEELELNRDGREKLAEIMRGYHPESRRQEHSIQEAEKQEPKRKDTCANGRRSCATPIGKRNRVENPQNSSEPIPNRIPSRTDEKLRKNIQSTRRHETPPEIYMRRHAGDKAAPSQFRKGERNAMEKRRRRPRYFLVGNSTMEAERTNGGEVAARILPPYPRQTETAGRTNRKCQRDTSTQRRNRNAAMRAT